MFILLVTSFQSESPQIIWAFNDTSRKYLVNTFFNQETATFLISLKRKKKTKTSLPVPD